MPRTITQNPPVHQIERLTRFVGVNLRADPVSMADQDVMRAINVDFHTVLGQARQRQGSASEVTGIGSVREIKSIGNRTFIVAGSSIYADFTGTAIDTIISQPDLAASIVEMTPNNAQNSSVFIMTGDQNLRVDSDNNTFVWGIHAPFTPPALNAVASGLLTGVYSVAYTYARKEGDTLIAESNIGATATISVSSENIDVDVVASPAAEDTHIRIYRTVAGGSVLLFDTEVNSATQTVTLSQDDGFLGSAVESDNNLPNTGGVLAIRHGRRIFYSIGDTLYWSKKDGPEAFPTSNFLIIGSTGEEITKLVSLGSRILVFTRNDKIAIVETLDSVDTIGNLPFFGSSTAGYVPIYLPRIRGSDMPRAITTVGNEVIFPARDGVFVTDGNGNDRELSGKIAPIFFGDTVNSYQPINFNLAGRMAGAYYKGRYYLSYGVDGDDAPSAMAVYSFDTQNWYFYDIAPTAMHHDTTADLFFVGDDLGNVDRIEDFSTTGDAGSSVSTTLWTRALDGGLFGLRKIYQYFKYNITLDSDDLLTMEIYIDDVLKHTETATQANSRRLLRLPAGIIGHEWRMQITGSGTSITKLESLEVQWKPLQHN